MGLKNNEIQKVTREDIYKKIDDGQIFGYYYGAFNFRKTYNSIFRKDRNASCGFYLNKAGKIIYNDIASGEKLDAFAFVGKKFNLNYGQAVYKVACDFGIIECKSPKINVSILKKIEEYEEELSRETIIDIEYDKWHYEPLQFWAQFGITEEELIANDVYNIKRLKINGTTINNYRGELRFAYVLQHGGKFYKKIYQPNGDRKFKWINNIPLHILYGYNKLPYKSDTVILCKAVKDMILVKKYHSDVLALQNESESALKDVTLDFLKKKYKRIVVILDNDEAGIKAAESYKLRGCESYYLGEDWKSEGCKDLADSAKILGLEYVKEYITEVLNGQI